MQWDVSKTWFHGSPLHLTSLRPGSTITQDRELVRVFSHRPSLVVQDIDDAGTRRIKHTGTQPGLLYRIAEELQAGDVHPHPETTMAPGQEWLTTRVLCVQLIGPTQLVAGELLTAAEIEEPQRKIAESRRSS